MMHSAVIYAKGGFVWPFDGHWGRTGVPRFVKAAIHVILGSLYTGEFDIAWIVV